VDVSFSNIKVLRGTPEIVKQEYTVDNKEYKLHHHDYLPATAWDKHIRVKIANPRRFFDIRHWKYHQQI
jgi:hypothetical protein